MNDRARVPFALVGVLLLVSAASVGATIQARGPPGPPDPATERAIERVDAAAETALRGAVRRAAREAARNPVLARAPTPAGSALNASRPFVDALRLRIYLAARADLARLDARVDGVRATAALPPFAPTGASRAANVTNATTAAVRRAIASVTVERVRAGIRVRVRNVTLTARRDDRVVARTVAERELVVRTPVLAIHDRVRAFERRLGAPPSDPGLGRRLTARLYAVAWARGLAQYGGAPVSNVIANRHVEVTTNGALLGSQRATLGASDPDGRRALLVAAARVGATDLYAAAGGRPGPVRAVARELGRATDGTGRVPLAVEPPDSGPDSPMRVGVDRSADEAYLSLVGGNLSAVLGSVYSADVRLSATVARVARREHGTARPDGAGWSLLSTDRENRSRVVSPSSQPAPPPSPAGWHRLTTYGRAVVRERTATRRWQRDGVTRTTTRTTVERFRVAIAVAGRHAPSRHAPRRPIDLVHRPGGPLAGPNLADVESAAVARLVTRRGGADALARRAVAGTLSTAPVRVAGERPADLRAWVLADLRHLRADLRNRSVSVSRGSFGTYRSNPAAMLADGIRAERTALVGAPARYDAVATKARVAARAAYLSRVLARLSARAARRDRTAARLDERLRAAGAGPLARVHRVLDGVARSSLRAAGAPSTNRSPATLHVDATPAYLSTVALDRDRIGLRGRGDVTPLVARNLNVFTVPYGDAADGVVGALLGPERVSLHDAAMTLRAAERLPATDNRTLQRRRDALRASVARSTAHVRSRLRAALGRADVGAPACDGRAILATALDRWPTLPGRALALANGSAVAAVERAALACSSAQPSAAARDRFGLQLRASVRRALESPAGRPPRPVVSRAGETTRAVGRAVLAEALDRGAGRVANRTRERVGRALAMVPAGLPVAPVPGYWYATTNLWHVRVRGEYPRFAVRTDRGDATSLPTTYVRDGAAVALDVDGDGRDERLGRALRVGFEVETVVVVVVPPGGRGVGDTGGDADERTSEWPVPG